MPSIYFLTITQFISIIISLIGTCGSLALYILGGIAYMKAAKLEGLKYPWLSWIPIANYYLIGAISDKIDEQNGKKSSKRTIMLILSIVSAVFSVIFVSLLMFGLSKFIIDLFSTVNFDSVDYQELISTVLSFILPYIWLIVLGSLLLSIISIILYVLIYLSNYNMFKKYDPTNAGIFIGVSISCHILLSAQFALPIFLLVALNKYEKTYQPIPYQNY